MVDTEGSEVHTNELDTPIKAEVRTALRCCLEYNQQLQVGSLQPREGRMLTPDHAAGQGGCPAAPLGRFPRREVLVSRCPDTLQGMNSSWHTGSV